MWDDDGFIVEIASKLDLRSKCAFGLYCISNSRKYLLKTQPEHIEYVNRLEKFVVGETTQEEIEDDSLEIFNKAYFRSVTERHDVEIAKALSDLCAVAAGDMYYWKIAACDSDVITLKMRADFLRENFEFELKSVILKERLGIE